MPDWTDHFPATGDTEAAAQWRPFQTYTALSTRVLAVATTRIEGAWSAYIDAVPGQRHSAEVAAVLDWGNKLPERVARVLFPIFEGVPYDR